MPLLPSGTHIAFDPEPVLALLEAPLAPENTIALMLLRDWQSLQGALGVVTLLPADEAGQQGLPALLSDDSLPAPARHVMVPTGMNVAGYQQYLLACGLHADAQALQNDLDGRSKEHFGFLMDAVRQYQQVLLEADADGARWGYLLANGGLS
ncbi:hypothetical protein [Chitinilyticum aquatile]|uniref:hypothetical protein n=1 Tax=Chitinilyticum aquatile TaxID=362520 RepID=UPI0003FC112A|nr:hypothetical protein [Chitinilyticum aquatile]